MPFTSQLPEQLGKEGQLFFISPLSDIAQLLFAKPLLQGASCLFCQGIHRLPQGWDLLLATHLLGSKYEQVESNCSSGSVTPLFLLQLVGTNYQHHLLKYVDRENLPEYLGGTSKATLLDDVGPWQQQNLIDEIDQEFRAAVSGAASDGASISPKGEKVPFWRAAIAYS